MYHHHSTSYFTGGLVSKALWEQVSSKIGWNEYPRPHALMYKSLIRGTVRFPSHGAASGCFHLRNLPREARGLFDFFVDVRGNGTQTSSPDCFSVFHRANHWCSGHNKNACVHGTSRHERNFIKRVFPGATCKNLDASSKSIILNTRCARYG